MQWLIDNWLLIALFGGMAAMHLFGHGHGHGRGKQDDRSEADDHPPANGANAKKPEGED